MSFLHIMDFPLTEKKKSVTIKDNDRQRSIRIKMFRLSEYVRHRPTDKNTEQVNR